MTPRSQYALFLGLAGIVAAGSAVLGRRHPGEGRAGGAGVLAAVPRGAWLLATVDVAALRSSPVAQAFASGGGVTLPGVGRLVDVCGFEPLAHVSEVALVDPEGQGDFGVAFEGDFDERALSECAEKIVRDRNGAPAKERHGSYTLIGDGSPASDRDGGGAVSGGAGAGRARLAVRRGGPFLVGRGAWLETMIDAVEGKADRAPPELLALRTSLLAPPSSSGGNGGARQVVVAALLPRSTRDQLKSEMQSREPSPPNEGFAGVLGVDRAGLGLSTGAAGSTTYLSAELHCEAAADCQAVKTLLEQKRSAVSDRPEVRWLGLEKAVGSVVIEASGTSLAARAELPTDVFVRLVDRAGALAR